MRTSTPSTTSTTTTSTPDTTGAERRRTRTRRGVGALAAAAALALAGTLVPASAASADDFYSDDELRAICNNAPTSQTRGAGGSCTFEVQSESAQHVEWLRYGEPVSNCNPGTTTGVKSTIGDVRTFSETWTAGGGASLELWEVLTIEGGGDYSQTRSVTTERRDEITANPGRKAAVTLGTGFVDQSGRIRVDVDVYENSNDVNMWVGTEAHYLEGVNRTVPTGYTEKGQDEVGCDQDFRVPA